MVRHTTLHRVPGPAPIRRHRVHFPRVIGFFLMLLSWLAAGIIWLASMRRPDLFLGTPWGLIVLAALGGLVIYILGLLSSLAINWIVRPQPMRLLLVSDRPCKVGSMPVHRRREPRLPALGIAGARVLYPPESEQDAPATASGERLRNITSDTGPSTNPQPTRGPVI